jgi:hypothetical protein
MYCPRCGQEQISPETRFCSRCGFLMAGVNQLLVNDGNWPYQAAPNLQKIDTPRKKGLKKGLFIFLLSFLVVPLLAIISMGLKIEPFAVVISAILLTVGGLLRMAYALLFESNAPADLSLEENRDRTDRQFFNRKQNAGALPAQQSIPVDVYAPPTQGNWRDTNDLTPSSVTDNTTKLLQKDKQ